MNLNETLKAIGETFDIPNLHHSGEDGIGGWDGDEHKYDWRVGSVWSVEGIILYELVRALKPDLVVEIGSRYGCSASHIAAALEANERGRLICVDNKADGVVPLVGMADNLREFVELVEANGAEWVEKDMPEGVVGLLFEDCDHHAPTVERIWRAAAEKLAPGGMLISHDALHYLVGEAVRQGIVNAGVVEVHYYLTEPSDCGLAIWRKPKGDSTPSKLSEVIAPKSTNSRRPSRKKTEAK